VATQQLERSTQVDPVAVVDCDEVRNDAFELGRAAYRCEHERFCEYRVCYVERRTRGHHRDGGMLRLAEPLPQLGKPLLACRVYASRTPASLR
jgi:hypothetical protein